MCLHPPTETPPLVNFTEPSLMYALEEGENAVTPLQVCLMVTGTDSISDGISFGVTLTIQRPMGSSFDAMSGKNLAISCTMLTLI